MPRHEALSDSSDDFSQAAEPANARVTGREPAREPREAAGPWGVREAVNVDWHSAVAFEEAAIGMAMIDCNGVFLAVNPAFCELVRRSADELQGATWQSITHPEDIGEGEREVAKAIGGAERVFRLKKRYIRPDGEVIWVLLNVKLMRDEHGEPMCFFTQVVDITDQRRAAEELARLASIVECSDDAMVSTDLEGTVLTWNHAAERIYGYTAAEIIGRSVSLILPPDRRHEDERLIALVSKGGSIRNFETVRVRKDKSQIDVSLTISPIHDHSGVPVRTSNITRDITEEKLVARALDHTLVALEVALTEARASEARGRQFFSDAAHHLRNPVAGMLACAETLLRGPNSVHHEQLLAAIAGEAFRIARLVDRLLHMARLEQGDSLMFETQDIVELCDHEVERFRSLAPGVGFFFAVGDGPFVLSVDGRAIREIFGNLLENARRHATSRVDVVMASADGVVSVRVTDDGPGVPGGAERQVFEPFVSLDGGGGFGLGLAVSRALACAHGGDLTYEDGTFVLRLRQASARDLVDHAV